jgi:hypothetical protein
MKISNQKDSISIFNGKYLEQNIKFNDPFYIRNQNDRYLYFYYQTKGTETSWSVDCPQSDGIEDSFSWGMVLTQKVQ